MKRCKHCGHTNGRLKPYRGQFTQFARPDVWECSSPLACIRRQEQLGEWVGKRVLRRIDPDGTEWTIRRGVGAPSRPDVDGLDFVLTMTYRDNRLTSWHTSIDAAKAHAEEMIASLIRPRAEDYRVADETSDEPGLFA